MNLLKFIATSVAMTLGLFVQQGRAAEIEDRGGLYSGFSGGISGAVNSDIRAQIDPARLAGYTYAPATLPQTLERSKAVGKSRFDDGVFVGRLFDKGLWAWGVETRVDLTPTHWASHSTAIDTQFYGSYHPNATLHASKTAQSGSTSETYSLNDSYDAVSSDLKTSGSVSARLRGGVWAGSKTLISGFVGLAVTRAGLEAEQDTQYQYTHSTFTQFPCPFVSFGCVSYSQNNGSSTSQQTARVQNTLLGFSLGFGVEHQVVEKFSIRLEAEYQKFNSISLNLNGASGGDSQVKIEPESFLVNLGLLRRF